MLKCKSAKAQDYAVAIKLHCIPTIISFPSFARLLSLAFGACCEPLASLIIALRPPPNFYPPTSPPVTTPSRPSRPTDSHRPSLSPYILHPPKMGLPIWRSPSPAAKTALKADLTAPARSPIRRRSSLVGRRARSSRSSTSPRLPDIEFMTELYADGQRISSSRPRLPPPPVPESRNYARQSESARDLNHGLAQLRRDRYYRTLYENSPIPTFGEITRGSRQLPPFTPNFAPAAAARSPRAEAAVQEARDRAAYRNRSPYHRAAPRARPSWPDEALVDNEDGDDSSDNNAVGFPPLRRMGRRTIADGPLPSSSLRESWSPATTLDGLGDRERSVSPVDDHWDNMLSTVAPDPIAPTAESSFASAAASASFSHPSSRAGSSNSNSATSSRTHLTVPSRHHSPPTGEVFMRACDTSEDDTASDTEEEEMDVRPGPNSLRRRSRQGYADEPPLRNSNLYSSGVRERSRDASAYVRSFYGGMTPRDSAQPERPPHDQFDGPAEEPSIGDDYMPVDREQELHDARALLERLARREDISEEFWASVGLTRPLADRIERIQHRERL
jgi:hypothetical protein